MIFLAKGNSRDSREMWYFMTCPAETKEILVRYSEGNTGLGPWDFSLVATDGVFLLIKHPGGGHWDKDEQASLYKAPHVRKVPMNFDTPGSGEIVWQGGPGARLNQKQIDILRYKLIKGLI